MDRDGAHWSYLAEVVNHMSEERKMVLQMLAEGKISVAEAETLLQALDESKRTEEGAAGSLEARIRMVERDARRVAGQTLRKTERILRQAGEGALRKSERAMREVSERRFVKMGVSIDRETVERQETLTIPAEPGDRLVLENRKGDVTVTFQEGDQIEVGVRKTVWGEDEADAAARAETTCVELVRAGSEVRVSEEMPELVGMGMMVLKSPRIDYAIRVPHGTHLRIQTKDGEVQVGASARVGHWELRAGTGNVRIQVLPEAGFRYAMESRAGQALVDLPEAHAQGNAISGQVGDCSGHIEVATRKGDICIQL